MCQFSEDEERFWATMPTEPEPIILSAEGSKRFVAAMLDDREPSEELKAAARRYREKFGV